MSSNDGTNFCSLPLSIFELKRALIINICEIDQYTNLLTIISRLLIMN